MAKIKESDLKKAFTEDKKAVEIVNNSLGAAYLLISIANNFVDTAMDQLRKGISLRAYGQVDPVISYKKEGFDMFDEMVERIQRTTISVLLKAKVEVRPANPTPQAGAPATQNRRFRRQMPEPLTNMSSFKQAMAAAQAAQTKQDNEENK